jgi:uncharacterized protein YndB with AHSA1/START domain
MDARVGGSRRMSFTSFGPRQSHAFVGTYLELVSSERARYTDKVDAPNLPGEMQATVSFRKERWARFPAWRRLVFLGSVVPLVLLGAAVHRRYPRGTHRTA